MDVVESWMRKQRVETEYARSQFIAAAKQGQVAVADLISFCELASTRISQFEMEARGRQSHSTPARTPCQCANCSGMNGWFASCLGYTP